MAVFTADSTAQTSAKLDFPPTYVVIFMTDFTFELISHRQIVVAKINLKLYLSHFLQMLVENLMELVAEIWIMC